MALVNNEQRQSLQDKLSASNAALITDIAERQQRYAESGEAADDLLARQREPHVETSSRQQPPAAYREMSDAERRPWDLWLHTALADLRDEVQGAVAAGFADRDALIDKLQREVTRRHRA